MAIFEDFLLYPAWVSCQPLDQSRAQALELSIDSAPKNSLLSVSVVMIFCQMNLLQIYKKSNKRQHLGFQRFLDLGMVIEGC